MHAALFGRIVSLNYRFICDRVVIARVYEEAMPSGGRRYRCAALALALVCVVAAACSSSGAEPPRGAPKSVVVHGTRLDYAGLVPWANPVTDPADPSAVYVFADNDRTALKIPACTSTADRTVVHETRATVTVTVAGFAYRLPGGAGCDGVGHAPVPVRVDLREPLGHRTLIDDRGKPHRVLDASTIPMPTGVDPSCTAGPLEWNERSGFVQRIWNGPPGRCPTALQYGPKTLIDSLNVGRRVRSIEVGDATARIWRYETKHPPRFGLTIRWTLTTGHQIQLTTGTETRTDALGPDQLIALARSMH